jgi:hypothetical protein
MSESYFPNHNDANGTQLAGYPGMPQQRPFDNGPTLGQPMPGEYPASGYGGGSSYGPVPPPPPTNSTPPLPRSVLAALVISVVLVLALGGFAFMTHGKLGDAETKADGLSQSLKKANESITAKQSELDSEQEKLKALEEQDKQMSAMLDVTFSCATQLDAAWDLLLTDGSTSDQIVAAYDASREACDQLEAAQGSAE